MRRMSNELLFIPACFQTRKVLFRYVNVHVLFGYITIVFMQSKKPLPIPSKVPGGPGDGHSSVNNLNVLEKRNGSNLPVSPGLYLVAL